MSNGMILCVAREALLDIIPERSSLVAADPTGNAVPILSGYLRQGCFPDEGFAGRILLASEWKERAKVEEDEGFKQIIPYVVFATVGQDGRPYIYQYRRGKGGGEERLHELISIGVGGHIDFSDQNDQMGSYTPWLTYMRAMLREIDEELYIHTPVMKEELLGIVNRDDSPVARVHIGFVHLITTLGVGNIKRRDSALENDGFKSVSFLQNVYDKLEPWSQAVIDVWR